MGMLKAMRLHIGMVKQEIELSIFFPTILLCLLTIMTSVRWAMPFLGSVCGLTYGYLNQGFHRLLAESAPGGEYETVRLLSISAKDMVWSKICLCGIWFSLTTSLHAYSAKTAHPFRKNGAPFRLKLSNAQ